MCCFCSSEGLPKIRCFSLTSRNIMMKCKQKGTEMHLNRIHGCMLWLIKLCSLPSGVQRLIFKWFCHAPDAQFFLSQPLWTFLRRLLSTLAEISTCGVTNRAGLRGVTIDQWEAAEAERVPSPPKAAVGRSHLWGRKVNTVKCYNCLPSSSLQFLIHSPPLNTWKRCWPPPSVSPVEAANPSGISKCLVSLQRTGSVDCWVIDGAHWWHSMTADVISLELSKVTCPAGRFALSFCITNAFVVGTFSSIINKICYREREMIAHALEKIHSNFTHSNANNNNEQSTTNCLAFLLGAL